MSRLIRALPGLVLSLGIVAAGFAAPAPAAAVGEPGKYYDGSAAYSQIINCYSVIQGAPYTEFGMGAYAGGWIDADDATPKVGESFPVHVVVSALGRACDAQRFTLGLKLPAGVSLDTAKSPQCFYERQQTTNAAECPAATQPNVFGTGTVGYRSAMSQYANTWPVPVGKFWEFRFWVKATAPVTGGELRAFVKVIDGNDSPTLQPTSRLQVFPAGAGGGGGTGDSGPVQVAHQQPSTYASPTYTLNGTTGSTKYGILSEGTLLPRGQAGTVHVRRGVNPYPTTWEQMNYPLPAGHSSFLFWTDWDEPGYSTTVAGQTYKWQIGFTPTGTSAATWGEIQEFTALSQTSCNGRPITASIALGQNGTPGDDVILGTAGDDTISGGGGDDHLCGAGGNDSINAGDGNDQVIGGHGDDIVDGGEGADLVWGGTGDDALQGGGGNDQLFGDDGADELEGGLGNDLIEGGGGQFDIVSYATATAAVKADLALTTGQNTLSAGSDTIRDDVEGIRGSAHADTLYGDESNNYIYGMKGNDTIWSRGGGDEVYGGDESGSGLTGDGNDRLYAGDGDDLVLGGDGDDLIDGTGGDDRLLGGAGVNTLDYSGASGGVTVNLSATGGPQSTGGSGTDWIGDFQNLTGSAHADHLTGTSGGNVIDGLGGNDSIAAGAGDDTVSGGTGNDALDGGAGTDRVSFASASSGVTVALDTTAAQQTGGAGAVTVRGFEELEGSSYADRLTGSAANDWILGHGGDDVLAGLGGDDRLDGGAGDDVLRGGAGDDRLNGEAGSDRASYSDATAKVAVNLASTAAQSTGGAGKDTLGGIEALEGSKYGDVLIGSAGDDIISGLGGDDAIRGGGGDDVLDGGTGHDAVSYSDAPSGVRVSLGTSVAQNTVSAGTDRIVGFEELRGSEHADTLIGSEAADLLRGLGGEDRLFGYGGSDRLYGGGGDDSLSGGDGDDRLVGEAGRDRLSAGAGSDYLNGGSNHDTLIGGTSADRLYGGTGKDRLYGQSGADRLYGDSHDDLLVGGTGDDLLSGGSGADRLYGDSGADRLYGNSGKDRLSGGSGRDRLSGGTSSDRCDGGSSRDSAISCEVRRRI